MVLYVFGKVDCAKCQSTKRKMTHFLERWDLAEQVPMVFQDMDTREGLAQGCSRDVWEVPTTILEDHQSGQCLARWDGEIPRSEELREHLSASP